MFSHSSFLLLIHRSHEKLLLVALFDSSIQAILISSPLNATDKQREIECVPSAVLCLRGGLAFTKNVDGQPFPQNELATPQALSVIKDGFLVTPVLGIVKPMLCQIGVKQRPFD